MFLLVVHEELSSRSSPRAIGFMLTLPRIVAPRRRGQCRTLMPRVRRPVASAPCLKDSWSDGPRAIGFMLTLPGGQCRTLLPRGPSPVVPASRRCMRDSAPCMSPPSPTCARPASLLLPPAAPRRRRHASLCCSLSCAKHLRCCTYGCSLQVSLQAPVSRAHTHA